VNGEGAAAADVVVPSRDGTAQADDWLRSSRRRTVCAEIDSVAAVDEFLQVGRDGEIEPVGLIKIYVG
jgi:hypothetical protein